MATYSIDALPNKLHDWDVINCDYSGSVKSCTLPKGQYKFECWGAEGGEGTKSGGTYYAGKGGYSVGIVSFSQYIDIFIYSGGKGIAGSASTRSGGFNGGGNVTSSSGSYFGGSGGGASDVRIGQDSLYARAIVAGGGGGSAGYYGSGGYGGGAAGESVYYSSTATAYATGGTQTSGGTCSGSYGGTNGGSGTFGQGGDGAGGSYASGAGGGGGWYGGAAGKTGNGSNAQPGGGGGSGYVYTLSTASNYPSGCLLNSSYYLTDAQTIAGNTSFLSPSGISETGHSGNGYVRITVISTTSGEPTPKIKLIGSWKNSSSFHIKKNNIWKKATKAYVKKETHLPQRTSHIYGAIWDGTETTSWTRTDDSADFAEPVPAVDNGDGSSPFDNCYPWSGMRRVEDPQVGTLVEIPKFWYKWTRNDSSMKLQISTTQIDGFYTSPAHADRGDGVGERNFVYVGAYHCANTNYKSISGVVPKASITRSEARTSIHNLGNNIWQWDYAMYWTICMLYLVEYADWDSQSKIGYGCGNGSSVENNGACDAMTYHTGTNVSSKTTYGHIRYRWIEDLWSNIEDWVDGIYFNDSVIYGINNPNNYSDTTGGTNIGTRPTSSGCITKWISPSSTGLEYAIYPSIVNEIEYTTYITDRGSNSSTGVALCVGGYYTQSDSDYYGLFCLNGTRQSESTYVYVGSRLMKLNSDWKKII